METGWQGEPELINKVELNEVELVMPLPNVTKDVTKELTERQRIILEMIMENALVTIPEMSQKTGVTTRTIKRDLEAMQSKGILAREGGRKDGQWIVRIQ